VQTWYGVEMECNEAPCFQDTRSNEAAFKKGSWECYPQAQHCKLHTRSTPHWPP